MRPVDKKFPVSQGFGGGATEGVDPHGNDPMAYLVRQYGNYQPYGHAGEDIACPVGTPVYAMSAGTVLWADWGTNLPGDDSDWGYRQRWYLYKGFPGIVTVIQHPWGKGIYAHLSSNDAAPAGTKVREGQLIGHSGDTGGVAPHLHVEALINDSYVTQGGLIYGRTNPAGFYGAAVIAPQSTTPKEPFTMGQYEDLNEKLAKIEKNTYNTWAGVWTGGTNVDGKKFNYGILPIVAESQRRDAIAQAQIKGLVGAIAALAKGEQLDEAKLLAGVQAAAEAGVKAGIADGTVTVDVNVNQ